MSNNIYDILKKFNNLDSVKNMLNEGKTVCKSCGKAKCKCVDESKGSKPDFLDMDKDGDKKEPMKKAAKEKSKGAVAEAVAQVEKQLNEKYMGFKKTVGALKKQGGIENPEGLAASIGRKKYGKEKFQKAAAAGKKLGEAGSQLPAPPDEVHLPKKGSKHGPVDVYKPKKNEDMLSPGQKKIARMSPPPDKIDANDLAALRAGKDKKKEEGAGVMHFKKQQAQADGKDSFKLGNKEYPVKEGFPTVADAKKRMDDREGKTTHGKKTTTTTGTRHERDYDAVDKGADVDATPKGRGRPKKDRFA